MDELPAHAKAVLRRAHQHDQCDDEDARRRVREGVERAVGTAVVGASVFGRARVEAQPAVPISASSSGAPLFALAGKLTASAALVALVATGIALRERGVEPREAGDTRGSAVVSAPAAQPVEPTPVGAKGTELPQATQDERAADEQRSLPPSEDRRAQAALLPSVARGKTAGFEGSRAPSRVSARDTLAFEVALLRQLGEAVARRDTSEARSLLAQHRARFAQPALLEERQGFQALVRCMEHSPGALVSSRAFVARYPNSVLTARVLHECEPERR